MSHAQFIPGDTWYTPAQRKEILKQQKWKYCRDQVDQDVLEDNFKFLNQAVVIRGNAQGIPLMTTTGIYGPIKVDAAVQLRQDPERIVRKPESEPTGAYANLLEHLKEIKSLAIAPKTKNCTIVQAKWISGDDGGVLPHLDASSNVFGQTGSLLIRDPNIEFQILDHNHPDYHTTMEYYGAKIIPKDTAFRMGFNMPLFGMEYDTSLPGYIQDYVMVETDGGGLFVEHHPFPHIWFPNPRNEEEHKTNVCRVLLGRVIPAEDQEFEQELDYRCDGDTCTLVPGNQVDPKICFTVFEVPTDGTAIAVDECCIHNDSFCNGKQVVFIADTKADTVAFRETSPYKNINVKHVIPPLVNE